MKFPQAAPKFLGVAILCSLAWSTQAQQLVVNGGFESGSFTPGFTNVDPSGFSGVGSDPAFANTGNNYAFLGASPNVGSLSQLLTTTPGGFYTLTFALANDSGTAPNFFQVLFGGNIVTTMTNASSFGYMQFTFEHLPSAGSSTNLEFRYMHGPDFFRLDDVSVTVPELGSTLGFALPTVAALLLLHSLAAKRRKGSAA